MGGLLWESWGMSTFKRVNETDEYGQKRPVTIEVTSSTVVRTQKVPNWQGRIPLNKIHGVSVQKSRMGADTVTATVEDGVITWKLKDGQALVNAIDGAT